MHQDRMHQPLARQFGAIGLVIAASSTLWIDPPAAGQCEIEQLSGIMAENVSAFPRGMALDDRFVIVGDPASPDLGNDNLNGQVLVFRRTGSNWSLLQVLRPPDDDGVCNERSFGDDLALDGNVLIVTDREAPVNDADCGHGAAYVYRLQGGQWVFDQKFTTAIFWSQTDVAIDGNTLALGMTSGSGGEVYIFREGDARWSLEAIIPAPTPDNSEQFGRSVAISNDVVLIGSMFDDAGSFQDGAAYIYRRIDGTWQLEQLLTPPAQPNPGWYGDAVALRGDLAAVGDRYAGSPASKQGGAVHLYRYDDRQWNPEAILLGAPLDADFFGASISINPFDLNQMLIGAEGQGFLYRLTRDGWQVATTFPAGGVLYGDLGLIRGDKQVHVFAGLSSADCNENGSPDACDIFAGDSQDLNVDGIPDECPLPADLNGDLIIGPADLALLLGDWGPCPPDDPPCGVADLDGSGAVAAPDLAILLANWTPSLTVACDAGDCCSAHDQSGCGDPTCCDAVCAADPYCCQSAWDALCAAAAQPLCGCPVPILCAGGVGDCCAAHPEAGCADSACCEPVCALDLFCCEVAWDAMCQAVAQVQCGCPPPPVCNPEAGDCCVAHFDIGCNDVQCCEAVCAIDGFCCLVGWDGICAGEAGAICEICAR